MTRMRDHGEGPTRWSQDEGILRRRKQSGEIRSIIEMHINSSGSSTIDEYSSWPCRPRWPDSPGSPFRTSTSLLSGTWYPRASTSFLVLKVSRDINYMNLILTKIMQITVNPRKVQYMYTHDTRYVPKTYYILLSGTYNRYICISSLKSKPVCFAR